ncbi:MAG: helix-turn-helix domain-containing protein [Bacteroidetes bacterium]|nr:helix-turn-helix domain-containing protein [Bacteroidota bacterium]
MFDQLRTARRQWAARENLPAYMVFSDATLRELATYLPLKTSDLASINGFGKIKIEKFGPQVVEVINQYCNEKNLTSKIHSKRTTRATRVKRVRAGETHRETLQLFREGKSVVEIAKIRNLSPTTIETHLAHWVKNGQIGIEQLMLREVIKKIKKAIVDYGQEGLKPIKEKLPEEITYGQIRLVYSDLKWRQSLKG